MPDILINKNSPIYLPIPRPVFEETPSIGRGLIIRPDQINFKLFRLLRKDGGWYGTYDKEGLVQPFENVGLFKWAAARRKYRKEDAKLKNRSWYQNNYDDTGRRVIPGTNYQSYYRPASSTNPTTQKVRRFKYILDSDIDNNYDYSDINELVLRNIFDNRTDIDWGKYLNTNNEFDNNSFKNLIISTGLKDFNRLDKDSLGHLKLHGYISNGLYDKFIKMLPSISNATTAPATTAPATTTPATTTPTPATTATTPAPVASTPTILASQIAIKPSAAKVNKNSFNNSINYYNNAKGRSNNYQRTKQGGMYFKNSGYIWYNNGRVFDTKNNKKGTYTPTDSGYFDINTIKWDKNGGKLMKYFQLGGSMQDQRLILTSLFMSAAEGDMETLGKIMQQTGLDMNTFIKLTESWAKKKDQDPEMAELAAKAYYGLQQAMSVKAKRGTKLEYIKMILGKCPEGYELKLYKSGGKVCKKCQKIEEACGGKKLEAGGESPIVTKFKNGRKCKK